MRIERNITEFTPEEFASVGAGYVAYMRQLSGKAIMDAFPGTVNVPENARVWGLFAADGTPIALADSEGAVLADAFHKNLVAVAVH